MGLASTVEALRIFDRLYPQKGEVSAVQQLAIQLADPRPFDLDGIRLDE